MKRFLKNIFYRVCIACEHISPIDQGHVLMYHSFNLMDVFFNVALEDFKNQIQFLQDNNYHIVSLPDFLNRKEQGLSLKKYITITCDDGYVDIGEMAQFLHERRLTATVFWPCGVVGDILRLSSGVRYKILSRDRMIEILNQFPNITLGSHGVTHCELTKITNDKMVHELRQSFGGIKNFTQHISVIAYPRGKYDKDVLEATRMIGYCAGLTTHEGAVNRNTRQFEIPRIAVDCTVDKVAFAGKLTRLYDWYVTMKKQWFK